MKKIVCVLLALLTLIPCLAFADGPDYSSMTADELRAVIVDARAALAKLEPPFDGSKIVYDKNGITISIDGLRIENAGWLYVDMTIINKSDRNINVFIQTPAINGWMVGTTYTSMANIMSGTNARKSVYFPGIDKEASITALEQVQDFAFSISIKDTEYNALYEKEQQTVTFAW